MSKKSRVKTPTTKRTSKTLGKEPPSVSITYDLFELPTAQHKAGLAGLLLQIESMRNRKKPAPDYRWDSQQPTTKVHVDFTKETMQSLFDDAYAATVEPEWFRQKKRKEHLKDERTRELRGSKVKEYLYDVVRPALPTMQHYVSHGASGPAWLRLWQEMLWGVPRGVNTTRIPFEVVAGWDRRQKKEERRVSGQHCPEGQRIWSSLIAFTQPTKRTKLAVTVKGHHWLGAQETTAEKLKFLGRLDQNLLLHFWHVASLVYVPQAFKIVREQGRVEAKRRYDGFAIAIPDITDLPMFVGRFRETLQELGRESSPASGRPRSSIIEMAAEGALSLFDRDRVAGLVQQKATSGEFRYSISGVDYLHFRPGKNGAKMLSAGRIALRPYLVEDYERITGRPGEKPPFTNPFFRRGLMLALLDDVPWFRPFGKLFADWPHEFFVHSEKSPKKLWFWADAQKQLQEVNRRMPKDPNNPPPEEEDFLAATINRFIRHYLDERLKTDAGYDFRAFRKTKSTPPEASDVRRKLAERLFLEFRSRRDQAFISHFTGTFFRVGQYMGRDFEKIAAALMTQTEDVKTLTLMSLSANSWIPATKKETPQ